MDPNQRGPVLIVVGIILIGIDWILLWWFPSLMLTFIGICLICGGCCSTMQASKAGTYQSGYQPQPTPQYRPQPALQQPVYQQPVQPKVEEKARFCPSCGATVAGKFCTQCGSDVRD